MTLRNDGLDAGDIKFKPGDEIPLESDGNGSKGDPVVFAEDGRLTPAASGEDFVGQLGDTPRWEGQPIRTLMAGPGIVADAAGDITAGDLVVPDGDGGVRVQDVAGGDAESIHHPIAIHEASAGETVVVMYR